MKVGPAVAKSQVREGHITHSSTDIQQSDYDRWRHNMLCLTTDLKLHIYNLHCFTYEQTGPFTLIRAQ